MTTTWVPTDAFGNRLRLVRLELGLSVEEIAARCQINQTTWSKWERGINVPRGLHRVVAVICNETGVDRNWLMWGGPLTPGSACIPMSADDPRAVDLLAIAG